MIYTNATAPAISIKINKGIQMTLCPVAIAVGCKKCPAFSVCPLKSVIGDSPKAEDETSQKQASAKTSAKKK